MATELTRAQQVVLAALAAAPGAEFAPVQIQKLFFLIDENVADALGGRQFNFEPYDYGPFDKAVYRVLEELERAGFASIKDVGPVGGRRRYSLTAAGQEEGERELQKMPEKAQSYIPELSAWIRQLTFAELVGAIYNAYPNMRENSIFQD